MPSSMPAAASTPPPPVLLPLLPSPLLHVPCGPPLPPPAPSLLLCCFATSNATAIALVAPHPAPDPDPPASPARFCPPPIRQRPVAAAAGAASSSAAGSAPQGFCPGALPRAARRGQAGPGLGLGLQRQQGQQGQARHVACRATLDSPQISTLVRKMVDSVSGGDPGGGGGGSRFLCAGGLGFTVAQGGVKGVLRTGVGFRVGVLRFVRKMMDSVRREEGVRGSCPLGTGV